MKFSTLFIIVGFIGLFLLVSVHEQTHVEIYETYGIKSKIYYFKDFPSPPFTIGEKACPNSSCDSDHNIAEIIGYHALPFYFLLFLGLFIMIRLIESSIELKGGKKK